MPAAILARFVLLEARRGGLPWLAVASIAVALGLAAFLSQVALTGSLALQASIVAALLRACAVFLIAAHVASSTLRELNDKELERMLSLPLSRSTQYLGRLAGFALCGIVLARSIAAIQSIAGGPLADASLPHQMARWAVDAVALLLPRLDAATRTGWLLYGPPEAEAYAAALAALMLYTGLLIAAGLFDFYRRNL